MTHQHRSALLGKANQIVNGVRDRTYGDPNIDFRNTAEFWTTYLNARIQATTRPVTTTTTQPPIVLIEPHDVALMMALLKVSRLTWNPDHVDSWLDIAGYTACGFGVRYTQQPLEFIQGLQ